MLPMAEARSFTLESVKTNNLTGTCREKRGKTWNAKNVRISGKKQMRIAQAASGCKEPREK